MYEIFSVLLQLRERNYRYFRNKTIFLFKNDKEIAICLINAIYMEK